MTAGSANLFPVVVRGLPGRMVNTNGNQLAAKFAEN